MCRKNVLNNSSNHIRKLLFDKEMCLYEYVCEDKTAKGLDVILAEAVLVLCTCTLSLKK